MGDDAGRQKKAVVVVTVVVVTASAAVCLSIAVVTIFCVQWSPVAATPLVDGHARLLPSLLQPPPSNTFHHSPKNDDFPEKGIISPQIGSFKMIIRQNIHFASKLIFWARIGWGISKGTTGYLIRVPFKCVLPIVARHLFAGVLALICGCAKTCAGTGVQVTLVCRCACTGVQVTAHTADLWSWVQSFRGKLESQNFNSITLFEMS